MVQDLQCNMSLFNLSEWIDLLEIITFWRDSLFRSFLINITRVAVTTAQNYKVELTKIMQKL